MWNEIKKAIISGLLISIGGVVFLATKTTEFPWVGAILFSAGLFTICEYGFNLYTGKVGYIGYQFKKGSYWGLVGITCLFNILTTFVLGALIGKYFSNIHETAVSVYTEKLNALLMKSFVSSIFCGILMFLAVDTWNRGKKIGVFLYVPVFILCGFDHSIANSFYNGAALGAHTWTLQNLWFVLVVVFGNGIGGMLIPVITRKWREEPAEKTESVKEENK